MNKLEATSVQHGQTLYHVTLTNRDGTAIRCRVNGQCKTWKTRPDEFRLPVKYGLRDCFYIDQNNCCDWSLVPPFRPAKYPTLERALKALGKTTSGDEREFLVNIKWPSNAKKLEGQLATVTKELSDDEFELFCGSDSDPDEVEDFIKRYPLLKPVNDWLEEVYNVTDGDKDMNAALVQAHVQTQALTSKEITFIVEDIKKTWRNICYDILGASPDGTATAETIREVVADYVKHPLWWKITSAQRQEFLRAAIGDGDQCI